MMSRLGQSLLRLQQSMEQTRAEETRVESLFRSWQAKWSDQRDALSERLRSLESQLDRLTAEAARAPAPRLTLVAFPPDADDMLGMGGGIADCGL